MSESIFKRLAINDRGEYLVIGINNKVITHYKVKINGYEGIYIIFN